MDLCPAVLVSHMPPPGLGGCLTPDLDVSLPISTSLPACRPASPSLPAPSQFPSDLAWALARHSGCPLPAARRTSLARKGRRWPRSGLGGCWQRLCSRQEAEEAGLGWGCGQTGLRGHGHKGPPRDPAPHTALVLGPRGPWRPQSECPWRGSGEYSPPPSTVPVPGDLGDPWAPVPTVLGHMSSLSLPPTCFGPPPNPWLRCGLPLPYRWWPWVLGWGHGWGWWESRMEPAH